MYVLYVDESATHGGSPAFVVGGVAVHEQDIRAFQARLDAVVRRFAPRGAARSRDTAGRSRRAVAGARCLFIGGHALLGAAREPGGEAVVVARGDGLTRLVVDRDELFAVKVTQTCSGLAGLHPLLACRGDGWSAESGNGSSRSRR
jgi:hypothetical protein